MSALQYIVAGVATFIVGVLWCAITDPAAWETDLGTVLLVCFGLVLTIVGVVKAVVK